MSVENDVYKKLNSVEIISIILKSDQGGETDLFNNKQIKHISIFEDVYTNCMSGYAMVVDAQNMINHFPIIGQETIIISFRTPGFNNDYRELEFEVYAVSDRTKSGNDKSEIYKLSFISKEYRLSETTNISKSISGTIANMVLDIFENNFPDAKALAVETFGEYKYIIPNWKPLETIDWLSERCVTDEAPHEANYVFFQNKNGYQFFPLSFLSRQGSSSLYEMAPAGVGDDISSSPNLYVKFFNIQNIEIFNSFDRLTELNMSTYSSNLIVQDSLKKSFTKTGRTYITSFDDTTRTVDYPYLPTVNRYSGNTNSVSTIKSRHTNLYDDYENVQEYENWFLKRKATLSEYDTLKIKITVSGNSKLDAGDCVNINIPTNEPLTRLDANWNDKHLSGKYLITSIRHSIDTLGVGNEYLCVMELSRCGNVEQVSDKNIFLGKGEENSDKRFMK